MPLYTYRCARCRKEFDLLEGMTQEKTARQCPHCGSREVTKTIPRIHVRSSGGKRSCGNCSGGNCSTCR